MIEQPDALTGEWISKEITGIRGVIEGAGMESNKEQRDFMLTRARERIENLEAKMEGSDHDTPLMRERIADLKKQREGIPGEHSEEEKEIRGYELNNNNDE